MGAGCVAHGWWRVKGCPGGRRGAGDRATDPTAPLRTNAVRDRVPPLPSPAAEKVSELGEDTSLPLSF